MTQNNSKLRSELTSLDGGWGGEKLQAILVWFFRTGKEELVLTTLQLGLQRTMRIYLSSFFFSLTCTLTSGRSL